MIHSDDVVFITHATLGLEYAERSLHSLLDHCRWVGRLYLYNTHPHEVPSHKLVEIAISCAFPPEAVVLVPYDRATPKTLTQDLKNIMSFLVGEPFIPTGKTLLLKSDYVLSRSFAPFWGSTEMRPTEFWSLPIYSAKEFCPSSAIEKLILAPSFVPWGEGVFYRGGDNRLVPRPDQGQRYPNEFGPEVLFVSHSVMYDFNVHVFSNSMRPLVNGASQLLVSSVTWGGMNELFGALFHSGATFVERTDAFAVHLFHDIISENRKEGRSDPRKTVQGDRY